MSLLVTRLFQVFGKVLFNSLIALSERRKDNGAVIVKDYLFSSHVITSLMQPFSFWYEVK